MLDDLTGKRFGRLTVLDREQNGKSHSTRWKCQCDCGNIVIVFSNSIKSGATQSCGCLWKEKATKHGMYGTRIYRIWDGMELARTYEDLGEMANDGQEKQKFMKIAEREKEHYRTAKEIMQKRM